MPKSRSHRMASRQSKLQANAKRRSRQGAPSANIAAPPSSLPAESNAPATENISPHTNEPTEQPSNSTVGSSTPEAQTAVTSRGQSPSTAIASGGSLSSEVLRIGAVMTVIGIALIVLEFGVGFGA